MKKEMDINQGTRLHLEMAARDMVIREFVQNAVEATEFCVDEHDRQIRFFGTQFDGIAHKLGIWNNGKGMTEDEILNSMRLFASGSEKKTHAQANFGIGAKVTGAKASPHGVIYWTCSEDPESEFGYTVLQFKISQDLAETKIVWDSGDGEQFITDVTEACVGHELFDPVQPWTAAIFLGVSDEHDTIRDIFSPSSERQVYWLPMMVNRRFYDVRHFNYGLHHAGDDWYGIETRTWDTKQRNRPRARSAKGMIAMQVEDGLDVVVPLEDGVKIRYAASVLSENAGSKRTESAMGLTNHGCLVWKNEIYDLHIDRKWRDQCHRYGCLWDGAKKQFTIEVFLPDTWNDVRTCERRLTLRYVNESSETETVTLANWADEIRDRIPEVFQSWLDSFRPTPADFDSESEKILEFELQALEELYEPQTANKDPDGKDTVSDGKTNEDPPQPPRPRNPRICPECGFENIASASVCEQCGFEFPVQEPSEKPRQPRGKDQDFVISPDGLPGKRRRKKASFERPQIMWEHWDDDESCYLATYVPTANMLLMNHGFDEINRVVRAVCVEFGFEFERYAEVLTKRAKTMYELATLGKIFQAKLMLKNDPRFHLQDAELFYGKAYLTTACDTLTARKLMSDHIRRNKAKINQEILAGVEA